MTDYNRLNARREMEVDVSADAFFAALTTWDGAREWKSAPLPLARCELFPGHRNGQVPCTRLVYPDFDNLPAGTTPDMVPEFMSETMLHLDPDARFILYRLDGEGPMGMRNYYATTEVNDLGEGRARVICTGRADMPASVPVEAMQGLLETTYERGVIGGTLDYIAAHRAEAA